MAAGWLADPDRFLRHPCQLRAQDVNQDDGDKIGTPGKGEDGLIAAEHAENIAVEFRHEHAAYGPRHAADADHRADRRARISMVILRAAFTVRPIFISREDPQPPATEPISESR